MALGISSSRRAITPWWQRVALPVGVAFALSVGALPMAAAQPSAEKMAAAQHKAQQVEVQMTDDERFALLRSLMVNVLAEDFSQKRDARIPPHVPQIAGWVQGVPRLGVPDLLLTDAGLGITNPSGGRPGDQATAFPSALAMAATFNPKLAYESGVILGKEAKARGFNVVLGGGINLARDPRHGRNFEYLGEDPLLAAVLAAESVKGTQDQQVVNILKHVSLNSQEINKWALDARIDPAAHRESEMLAFQIGIERSSPGSLMCAYNKVNGDYACGSDALLNRDVKLAMGYKGFIMSDWRAVYGWDYALKGLDQQSGAQLDDKEWFGEPLRAAYARGDLPKERLSDMVRRILFAIYQVDADQWHGPQAQPDMQAHLDSVVEVARQGTVLLKNEGNLLPLRSDVRRIAVIGGFSHLGMLSGGGGSSRTEPVGGLALDMPLGGTNMFAPLRRLTLAGPSPVSELGKHFPQAEILTDAGESPADAALQARNADVAIVFAWKYESENHDHADLSLPWGQAAVIDAVTRANPNTIVVLQTGNAVDLQPWGDRAKAIVQSWYSGSAGGRAIAEILAGKVNPSGRLPITFYRSLEQTPHPKLPGLGTPMHTPTTIDYHEGAEVGYRWMAKTGAQPAYAFGHGLSYTRFAYGDLQLQHEGARVQASFTVQNTGPRAGADVPQLYLTSAAGQQRMRLLGFERVELQPGESRRVQFDIDPRLLARFDSQAGQWRITPGVHRIALGHSAANLVLQQPLSLSGQLFGQ